MGQLSRVLELAQPKEPKTIWLTTPWDVRWGNQEPIYPVSDAALRAVPTKRLVSLAQPKKDFSRLQEEELLPPRRLLRSSCPVARYERIVHLATPKRRFFGPNVIRSPHTAHCEYNCPIWHVDPRVRTTSISPRVRQLASPKPNHPCFQSNKEMVETLIPLRAKMAQTTSRLELLALPMRKDCDMFFERGRPEQPIWPVSKGAKCAKASPRISELSLPKLVAKDYLPPRNLLLST